MFRCQPKTLYVPIAILLLSFLTGSALAQNRGTFVGALNYPAGPPTISTNTGFLLGGVQPIDAKLGDLNGDGKPDVIVAASCIGPNTPGSPYGIPGCPSTGSAVVAYLSNGDGTFQQPLFSAVNSVGEIRSIAVGDFNNDGKLDVAVVSDCDSIDCTKGSVSVLLGAGDGTFTQVSQYTFDGIVLQPGTLAVGDFNGDGKLDLAVGQACFNLSVSGCTAGAISIYFGNGDGTLSGPATYPAPGNNTALVVAGDFNGDGKPDVISGSAGSGVLTILLSTGSGTFTESTSTLTFGGLTALAAADFNGDGKLDLAIVSSSGVQIVFGNGDGTFQNPVPAQSNLTFGVQYPFEILAVDVNGDGKPDLLVSGSVGGNGIEVWLNDGTGDFTATQSYPMGGWQNAPIIAADFNGDGKVDVVMAAECSESTTPGNHCPDGSIDALLGNGDGTFQGPVLMLSPGGSAGVLSVAATDFNGDGVPDLLVSPGCVPGSSPQVCGAAVLFGTLNGTYQSPIVVQSGAQSSGYSLSADFNGDGKSDLAILNACDSSTTCAQASVSVSLGNGDGTFQPAATYPIPGITPVGVVAGDFNGDGILDLAAATQCSDSSCSTGAVSILLGKGDGTFQPAVTTTMGAGIFAHALATADFDHDGKTDLVVGAGDAANPNAGLAIILLSNGDGTLRIAGSYNIGGVGAAIVPATGDINHDGNTDVVFANFCESSATADASCSNGSIGVLLGNGDGTFQPVQETVVADGNLLSANLTDIDGDGNLDLISSTTGGVLVARGKGDGTFLTPVIYGGLVENTQPLVLAVSDLNNDGAPDIVKPDQYGNLGIFYNRGGTFVTTQSSLNPSTWGQSVQFTATVSPSIAKNLAPSGTVSFYLGNPLTGRLLFTVPLVGGTASLGTNNIPVGTWPITAVYSGDANFNPHAVTSLTQVVAAATSPTTTTLASSLNPAQIGQSVTFTATVSGGTSPTGSVAFNDGATLLATVALTGGQATYTTSSLAAGSHAITATYSGDAANGSSASSTVYESVLNPQSGAALIGVVTDRNTGAPIAGVNVIFGCGSCGTQTVTDANGQYSLTAVQISNNSNSTLIFQGHGYFATQVNYTITGSPTTVNATLLAGGTLVQGIVTDVNTHVPIAGASVGIANNTQTLNGLGTTTDSNGNFAFDSSLVMDSVAAGFPSQGLSVTSPGYFTYIGSSFQVAPPYPVVMNAAMIPAVGTVLQGTVTDRNTGVPLPGVNVIFGCGSCGTQTVTDANGQYSLTAAQISNHGTGALLFQGHGYFVNQVIYTISSSPTTVNATLMPGGTLVQGMVTDANTHLRVAGATVDIGNSTQTLNGLQTTTDNSGSFAFDSSLVFDSVASGFSASGLFVTSSPGYFVYSGAPFVVQPPYPVIQNAQLTPTGVTVSVNVTTSPANLQVAVDGVPATAPATFTWVPGNPHTIATSTPQPGSTGTQYAFAGWSNGGTILQTIVTPASNTTYTASFNTQYLLTSSVSPAAGGTITAGGFLNAGSSVTITATPNSGYQFTGFSGALSGTTNPQTLIVNGPMSITATFAPAAAPTTTTLVSSANPVLVGQSVTFTATVSGGTSPTGSVTFNDGAANLAAVALTGNQAVYTTSSLAVGSHPITATYGGDSAHTASTSATLYESVLNPQAGAALIGIVTDRNTGVPIPGVAVWNGAPQCPSCGSPLTVTDASGGYSLTAAQVNSNPKGSFLYFQESGYYVNVASYVITSTPTTLNVTLLPGGTVLQGTVADVNTQAGITGASITLSATSNTKQVVFGGSGSVVNVTTGAGVQYAIDSSTFFEVAASGFAINSAQLSAPGYFNTSAPGFPVNTPFPIKQNFTMLAASGVAVQGTITDRSTGQPIAGVGIQICAGCPSVATTDASGSYSLAPSQINNNASGFLYFQAIGYYVNSMSYAITATPTTLNATLLPGGTVLQGTVTDANTQAGIVGASLVMTTQSAQGTQGKQLLAYPMGAVRATTVSGGQYSVDSSSFYEGAATGGFTVSSVQLSASGYFNTSAVGFPVNTPFPVTQNFTMILTKGVVLQGTVTDRSTGQPIAGVGVQICAGCTSIATTDASGSYSVTGSSLNNNASGVLYFQAAGYYVNYLGYTITAAPTTLNATVLPGGTVLQGTVADASTQAGLVGVALVMTVQSTQGKQLLVNSMGSSLNATTVTGGQYTVDSSNFFELAASGFTVSSVQLSAPGYVSSSVGGFAVATPFPVTQNFTMSSNGTLASVTVATNPPGLLISVDGTAYTAPQSFQWQPSNSHTIATSTPQAATSPGAQYAYAAWSDGGALSHTVVAPASNATYTASFNTQYLLTTSASPAAGGSVTVGGYFSAGSSVTITATPSSGYTFTGFSGDLSGTTNPQTVVMNAPKNVTASFAPSIVTTTTSISALAASYGTAASVAVSVTAAQGTATGNVSLTVDNGAPLTQALSNGSTPFSVSGLTVGSHNLSASYAAQGNFGASSATGTLQVNQATTTVSVSDIPGNAVFGGSFTATYAYTGDGTTSVSSNTSATCSVAGNVVNFVGAGTCTLMAHATAGTNYGAATGSPQSFNIAQATPTLSINNIPSNAVFGGSFAPTFAYNGDGTTSITSSTATCTVSGGLVRFVAAGTCTLTAHATAGSNYAVATGAPQSFIIAQATTTISINNIPTAAVFGSGFTATYFYIGDGIPSVISSTPATCAVSGSAVSFVGAGACTLMAHANAGTNYAATTGSQQFFTIAQATTATTATSSQNPQIVNQPITFTATVASQFAGAATGSVTFKNGATTLRTVSLSGNQASFTTSFATAGTRSITAQYTGDANNLGSTSSALSQSVVAKFGTTTTLASSLNPSFTGQAVTFTATASSAGGAPPNGELITFKHGATTLGTVPLSGDSASFTISTLAVGTNTITASYAGDTTFAASTSAVLKQVVNKYPTNTTLASSFNPSTFGQSVTFTANVTSNGPSAPTGTVVFKNGTTTLATVALTNSAASLTRSNLPAGTLAITATYNGDALSAASASSTLSQVVNQVVTTTALASSRNPSTFGQSVTFTATVTSPTTTPTGTVTFTSGSITLGTVTLVGGKARLSTTALPRGASTITATYNGTANITASSIFLVQTVN
ncbi:MAG TPA: Ig-like domain repeat protein [Candidatus Acidoferrum sp.]